LRKKIVLGVIIALLCSTSAALGFVIGDSNFGMIGYPKFTDNNFKPSIPYARDQYSADQYRSEVVSYRENAMRYIDASNNDIRRIQEEKTATMDSVNEVVREYNSYVKGY